MIRATGKSATGEVATGVVCPVLGSPVQQRDGAIGESPMKGHKDDPSLLLLGKAEGAGTVQIGEEEAQGGSHLHVCININI